MSVQIVKTGIVNTSGEINPNLLPNQGKYNAANPYILTTEVIDGYRWLPNSNFVIEPSTTYTYSVYCDGVCSPKHATDGSEPQKFAMWLYLCNDDASKAASGGFDSAICFHSENYNHVQQGQRHSWVYTTASTHHYMSVRFNNYGDGTNPVTRKYWNIKIEKGNTLTAWNPNVNDAEYVGNTSGFNETSTITQITKGYVMAPDFMES